MKIPKGVGRLPLRGAMVRLLPAVFLALLTMGLRSEPVPTSGPIPRKNYKTWSLFLVCDPSWLEETANSKANLRILHNQFVGFGNAIGRKNAAIWFYTHNSADPADYDGLRASDYCSMYGLKSSENPVVVVTTGYPSIDGPAGNYVKVSLKGLDSTDTDRFMGLLADQIRSSELDQQQIDSNAYWTSWEHVLKNTLAAAGKISHAVTVQFHTPTLDITLSGKDLS